MKRHGFMVLGALVMTCVTVQAQSTSTIVFSRGRGSCSVGGGDPCADGDDCFYSGQTCYPGTTASTAFAIRRMNDDGTNPTPLTCPTANEQDRRPSICSKAGKVVFERTDTVLGRTDIFIVGPVNSTYDCDPATPTPPPPSPINLTHDLSGKHEDPDCGSPDGSNEYILFRRNQDDPNGDIYRINLDGSGVKKLTDTLGGNNEDREPAWCGDKVVWSRRVLEPGICPGGLCWEIWQADWQFGLNPSQGTLPTDAVQDRYPACDGGAQPTTRVAFSREPVPFSGTFGGREIWRRNFSTQVELQVTESDEPGGVYAIDRHPGWSPGARMIAFWRNDAETGHPSDIWKINSGGSFLGLTQLTGLPTDSVFEDVDPDWGELGP